MKIRTKIQLTWIKLCKTVKKEDSNRFFTTNSAFWYINDSSPSEFLCKWVIYERRSWLIFLKIENLQTKHTIHAALWLKIPRKGMCLNISCSHNSFYVPINRLMWWFILYTGFVLTKILIISSKRWWDDDVKILEVLVVFQFTLVCLS